MQLQNNQKYAEIPHHTFHKFSESKQPNIFFSSCFDSGNMHKVNRNSYDHYSIWTASDAQGTSNEGYPKSWFYFEAGGFINRKITFSVHRVHFLWSVSKKTHLYRPVYKIQYNQSQQSSKWERLPHPIISLNLNGDQELVLKFDFFFTKDIKSVKFAFLYPYSYEEERNDILQLKQKYEVQQDKQIFFKHYEMIKSYQKRIIDMVIISSHQGKDGFENIKFDQYFDLGQKLVKFRDNKPIVFISARVHPIETPSSFCMNGVIKFLLDKNDFRAHLLRKFFVFILVPMLNPDGVSNGHCRMDHLNQNLNRYYKNPDPIKQPSCYAVRKLCEHYQKDKRMFMYLDLHAHPAVKGNFMFGNAIYDFIEQVESQLFPKILSQNCINFQFQNCIFSRKHMKAKDRNQDMNKQGCGRVVFYKDFGIPHAYTLQCGYHLNAFNNTIQPERNIQNKFIVRYKLAKNGQKIYENIERVCSQQIVTKIEQNLLKFRNIQTNTQYQGIAKSQNNFQQKQALKQGELDTVQQDKNIKRHSYQPQSKSLKRYSNVTNINISNKKIRQTQKLKSINENTLYDGYDIFEYTPSPLDNSQNEYYKRQIAFYKTEAFENLGRNILITILDIFSKNPYSRSIDLNQRRKQIAEKQSKLDRFRKQQAGIRNKMKNIVQLIEQQFYSHWYKRNVFNHSESAPNGNTRRNKTLQFQITKSSYNKIRNHQGKQLETSQTKKQINLETHTIKDSVQDCSDKTSGCISSLNKLATSIQKPFPTTTTQPHQQYQSKNILLTKKLRSIKSNKHKNPTTIKQLNLKESYLKEQIIKRSIPLSTTHNNLILQQEIKILKNNDVFQGNSSKVIRNPSYNVTNLRARNFMLYGTNNIGGSSVMGGNYMGNWSHYHAHSLSNQNNKK